MNAETILSYGAKLIIIFMVIPIHEFAHAWAADKLGDDTPRYQGRLTLNPLAHIDIIGALCIFFIGFGWGKPVQVNPIRFKKYRRDYALTAAAGPISNLIVALIGIIFYKVCLYCYFYNPQQALYWLTMLFYYFTAINVGLAVFNLIPIPPLDGSKIFSYFLGNKLDGFMYKYERYIALGFILLVFTGLLDRPLGAVQSAMFWIMDKLTFWLDPLLSAILN